MAIHWHQDGRMTCAAETAATECSTYIDDRLHHELNHRGFIVALNDGKEWEWQSLAVLDWVEDLNNFNLPAVITAFNKLPDGLNSGDRVGWWGREEEEYLKASGDELGLRDLERDPPYQGVIVHAPDIEIRDRYRIDPENSVIIMDQYPIEKCYPEATYMATTRLLNNKDLVKIVKL